MQSQLRNSVFCQSYHFSVTALASKADQTEQNWQNSVFCQSYHFSVTALASKADQTEHIVWKIKRALVGIQKVMVTY